MMNSLGRLSQGLSRARGVRRRLLPYMQRERRTLTLAGLATAGSIACDVARPWPVKLVIDQVLLARPMTALPVWLQGEEHRLRLLWVACLGLLAIAAIGSAFGYLKTLLLAAAGQEIVARMRRDLYRHMMALSLGWHGGQRSGDLLVRLTGDAATMKTLLVEGLFIMGQETVLILATLGVMAAMDVELTLVSALAVPTVAVVVLLYGRRLKGAARKQREKEGQIAAAVGESLLSVPVIQAYGLQDQAIERFRRQNKKSLQAGLRALRLESAMGRWTDLALAAGTSIVLGLGAYRALAGQLSTGELVVLISYVRTLQRPLRHIATAAGKVVKAAACGDRILEVLDTPIDLVDRPGALTLPSVRGAVSFEGVRFAYPGGHEVLRGIDLRISPGERVALLGSNGAGKSTLLSLVPRLRDVTAGTVRVDGHDVREVQLESLRARIAFVFQQSVLFDGTLLENIQMGNPAAPEPEVLRAAERAGVSAFAQRLPLGMQTPVGEGGLALSGGQRQRVTLARALLRPAAIVVFDEPTASLDRESEQLLNAELLRGLEGRTVLLVTHRPDLLAAVDRIVTLEQGRVIADTSAAEAAASARIPALAAPIGGRP